MSKTTERVTSYTEAFRNERVGLSVAQLEAEKDQVLAEMEELADAEEFHSFQYAEAKWEYDVLEMIIRERNEEAEKAYLAHTVTFYKNKLNDK